MTTDTSKEQTIKAIIVDDEELARESLKNVLIEFKDIQIIKECANGFEAVQAVHQEKPDLLFLDIQMPKLDGFDVAELLGKDSPIIIFVTSYDEYALRAFEAEALDYILKPAKPQRLKKAIDRVRDLLLPAHPLPKQPLSGMIDKHRSNSAPLHRILIRNGMDVIIIPINEIVYFEAQDDYVRIHTSEKSFLKTDRMSNLEKMLNPTDFCRIHRSFLLNVNFLKKIEPYSKDSRLAILKTGPKLPISRSGYNRLMELL
jgi:two-component system, LytTR family, response regulator